MPHQPLIMVYVIEHYDVDGSGEKSTTILDVAFSIDEAKAIADKDADRVLEWVKIGNQWNSSKNGKWFNYQGYRIKSFLKTWNNEE